MNIIDSNVPSFLLSIVYFYNVGQSKPIKTLKLKINFGLSYRFSEQHSDMLPKNCVDILPFHFGYQVFKCNFLSDIH